MKQKCTVFFGYASLVLVFISLLLFGFLDTSFHTTSLAHGGLGVLCFCLFLFLGGVRKGSGATRSGTLSAKREMVQNFFYILFFLGTLVLGAFVIRLYLPLRFDFTEEKVHSLSSHTVQILSQLEKPLLVRIFSLGAEPPSKVKTLLDRYAAENANFRWQALDPDMHRTLVEKLGIQEKDTLHFAFPEEKETQGIILARNIDEEGITNSLITLLRGRTTTIYVPQSHGEGSLVATEEYGFSFLRESLMGEGYSLQVLDLILENSIPLKDSLLLVLAPKKEFLEGEKKKIREFLDAGGSAFFLLEPLYNDLIKEFLLEKGIVPGDDMIVDREAFTFKDGVLGVQPLVDTFTTHPSVGGFNKTIIMSTASSVRKAGGADQVNEVAFTSPSSWAETNIELLYSDTPTAEKDDNDIAGPVSIAAVFQDEVSGKDQRIMAIGDLDFVANANIRQLFNRDFVLNAINWTVGEDYAVSIRAGTLRKSQEVITPSQFKNIFIIAGVLLPEIVLLLGIGIWVSRR
jgi:hypothetical protein